MSTILKDGKVIRRSRNLRGLLSYPQEAWSNYVAQVAIDVIPTGGSLRVTYGDGAVGESNFASFSVLQDWLRNRRSWHGAKLTVGITDCGILGKESFT